MSPYRLSHKRVAFNYRFTGGQPTILIDVSSASLGVISMTGCSCISVRNLAANARVSTPCISHVETVQSLASMSRAVSPLPMLNNVYKSNGDRGPSFACHLPIRCCSRVDAFQPRGAMRKRRSMMKLTKYYHIYSIP